MFQATSPQSNDAAGITRQIYETKFSTGYIGSMWLNHVLQTLTIETRIHGIGLEEIDEVPNEISWGINRALEAMGPAHNFAVNIF